MYRIDDPSAVPTPPTIEAPGTEGYFTEGVPGVTPATVVRASWLISVQELLRSVVTGTGLTPSKTVYTRLLEAVKRLASANVRAITGTTTLTADDAGYLPVTVAANATITLPAANAAGGTPIRITLARLDATASVVTLSRAGADLIEGLTSITLPVNGRLTFVSDGVSSWRIVAATLGRLINVQKITATGTYTPTPGATAAIVEGVGGGAAGGGLGATGAGFCGAAGGGGAGAYGKLFILSGLTTQAVTIGAAGVAGTGVGGNGGTSSFGALLSCPGGIGGGPGSGTNVAAITSSAGGGGPAPTGATVGVTGSQGTAGFAVAAASAYSGTGGSSPFGTGGAGIAANGTVVTTGIAAGGNGAGGGGAIGINSGTAMSGGAGSPGLFLVKEYS